MTTRHVHTTINGEPAEFLCEPVETLLDALRNRLSLTGTKEGCATGDCGACSVLFNERLVPACLVAEVEFGEQHVRRRRAEVVPDGARSRARRLPTETADANEGRQTASSLARVEWEHISRVLADCGGNISKAARVLNIHRRSLQRKLSKYPPRR